MTNDTLHCTGLCKTYGKQQVLHDIELTLEPGRIYGLIGRNGAGKTTLLSILSGQNPETSGQVQLGQQKVWKTRQYWTISVFSGKFKLPPVPGSAS